MSTKSDGITRSYPGVKSLLSIHDFTYSRGLIDPTLITDAQKNPDPSRATRCRTDQYGRWAKKISMLGAHASRIRGWPVEEGRALLRELTAFVAQPQYTYAHKWRDNDLVIWDNILMKNVCR